MPSSRTSKSSTSSFVSSVPFRLPTAHTSFVLLQRIRHTTPPLLPLSSATRLRRNSPVRRSHILTVPSSLDVITNVLLNCRHVTALWCLFGPVEDRKLLYYPRNIIYFIYFIKLQNPFLRLYPPFFDTTVRPRPTLAHIFG